MKNSFLQLGIVYGFVNIFKTTSNFYNDHKTSYGKNAMQRLMNEINQFVTSVFPGRIAGWD